MNEGPIFIVSSGRSGSQLFYKLFNTIENIKANHEFNIMSYKPEIVKFMNSGSSQDLEVLNESLNNHYYKYIDKKSEKIWLDSNYSISPILDILLKNYPNANFNIHAKTGQKIGKITSHPSRAGMVITEGESREDAINQCEKAIRDIGFHY